MIEVQEFKCVSAVYLCVYVHIYVCVWLCASEHRLIQHIWILFTCCCRELYKEREIEIGNKGWYRWGQALNFMKPLPSPSLLQLQREASPEASRVHLPLGEAAKLGGKLLRGPLCHPDTGPAQNGNCHPHREEMIHEITEAFTEPLGFVSFINVLFSFVLHVICNIFALLVADC